MKRCINCLRPDTLPGVVFENGVCPACIRYEARSRIDWQARYAELKKLCDAYRSAHGTYDCIIPVSGGKDSYFQVHVFKNIMNMNPLLVCVTDPFTHTPEGIHNYDNISKAFDCDMITLRLSPERISHSSFMTLKALGSTNWEIDKAIYAWPLRLAMEMGIKLVVYGENVSWEYGGPNAQDTPSANEQIKNNVVSEAGEKSLPWGNENMLWLPHPDVLEINEIQGIYLSYFYPWNDFINIKHAECYGFRQLKSMSRAGYIDMYAQIDSVGYLFNYYLKFMKYGIGRIVDIGSRWVRYGGAFTTAKLKETVLAREGAFDLAIAADYCKMIGKEWDEIQPIVSRWWNRDIFDVAEGSMEWKWKNSAL